ncbi:hypothetical protein [Pseudoclavibacter sp. AY1H1]|uniref:hypothetical protein n=1 Tax=Pseudoclavibacter sp. AY1H1 TaxID=2080584 RepID=UPI0011B04180|nr:hypothetical protein [Pseudoclavibacter sp. AY1H1]
MTAYKYPVPGERVKIRGTERVGQLAAMGGQRGALLDVGNSAQIEAWYVHFPDTGAVELHEFAKLERIDS